MSVNATTSRRIRPCLGTWSRVPVAGPERDMRMPSHPVARRTWRRRAATVLCARWTSAFLKYWAASSLTQASCWALPRPHGQQCR
eukprot:4219761-Alexandrium_andersonii.AAC.1